MTSRPYHELPGLGGVYLEDSYVLDIVESDGALRFDLDVALTEAHPDYQPSAAGEARCYRRGSLMFTGYRDLVWHDRTDATYTDAAGETDHGNIDTFTHDGDTYRLTGDWGAVTVNGGTCALDLAKR